ncbi:MAG: alpha amylase C-terminal domain-containing protein [Parachlamydiaceae bacterium]|nr:alpha amylase C-terminal domain-containing protein [Parachlamydiaceae bacterium]
MWEKDFNYETFQWIDFSDTRNNVICYVRHGHKEKLLCVHNFTPTYHADYFIRFSQLNEAKEVFNSDAEHFGGSGKMNHHSEVVRNWEGHVEGLRIALAPLATMIFEIH